MSKNDETRQNSTPKNTSMKVAVFCLTAILVFYFGISFLRGLNFFNKKTYYYAVLENIGNLHESSTIAINGYPIGKVSDIKILSTDPVKICAEMMITEKIALPEDTRFEVAQSDILGGVIVNVIVGHSNVMAHNKDTLSCTLASGIFDNIGDLTQQLSSILASIDTVGLSFKEAFRPDDPNNGISNIRNTLANMETLIANFNKMIESNEDTLHQMVLKLNDFSTTLHNAAPQLNAIVNNLDNITDTLARNNLSVLLNDTKETMSSMKRVMYRFEHGEGTLGQLMQNDSIYNNINRASESLDMLLKDLKENPERYLNIRVFGKGKSKK